MKLKILFLYNSIKILKNQALKINQNRMKILIKKAGGSMFQDDF